MHGLWAGFLNLIHSLTYAQVKPIPLDTKAAQKHQEKKLHFFDKKWKTVFIPRARFKAPKGFQNIVGPSRNVLQSRTNLQTSRIGRTKSHFS